MVDSSEHLLTNPKRISWLINSLKKQHQSVKISFDGTDLYGNSLIVDVQPDNDCFLLDTIVDQMVHDKIAARKPFTLYSTLDGVDVRVEQVKVSNVVDDPNGCLYQVSNPTEVYYIQRRETFRASLSGLFDVDATVEIPASNEDAKRVIAGCKISNISAAGCQLEIPKEYVEPVLESQKALGIQFDIPESNDSVSLSAMMRHNRELKRAEIVLVGFQFVSLSAPVGNAVERFVAKVQQMARHNGLA